MPKPAEFMDEEVKIKVSLPPKDKRNPHALYFDKEEFETDFAAVQSAKDECDINLIIDRAARAGNLSNILAPSAPLRYADVSEIPDYRSAQDAIIRADTLFMTMDAKVRERFHNNPAEMLDFVANNDNYDEAVKLGLVVKKETPPAAAPAPSKDGAVPPAPLPS